MVEERPVPEIVEAARQLPAVIAGRQAALDDVAAAGHAVLAVHEAAVDLRHRLDLLQRERHAHAQLEERFTVVPPLEILRHVESKQVQQADKVAVANIEAGVEIADLRRQVEGCLLYTSPSPRD